MEVNTELRGEDAQSKFKYLDRPLAHPGSCISCGATDRPVVDFGVEADFEHLGPGQVYFCGNCVKQAASKFPSDEPPHVCTPDAAVEKLRSEFVNYVVAAVTSYDPPSANDSYDSEISSEGSDGDSETSTGEADGVLPEFVAPVAIRGKSADSNFGNKGSNFVSSTKPTSLGL